MQERYTPEELKRFNSKWISNGKCHIWQRSLDKDGYGTFYFRRLPRRAHRVAYYIHIGDIPNGMVVDHICGVRNCVKAAHLRILTPRENSLDSRGIGAQNARKTHCSKGHPFDRKYGGQRYCSTCQSEKRRHLYGKWRVENKIAC